MSESFEITAQIRNISGRGASRRLRNLGQVPAIVYGGKKKHQLW
jgi:large subunit ribosomal protein L25